MVAGAGTGDTAGPTLSHASKKATPALAIGSVPPEVKAARRAV